MIKTNRDLVAFVESKLNVPTMYMLGGFGRVLTHGMINYRINRGCRHTIANRRTIEGGIGRYVYDCVGLIKGGLWEIEKGNVRYNIPVGSDQNVGMMYRAAKEKGNMSSMPEIKGLLVYTANLSHVGIYVGKKNGVNQYVEATPAWGAWGVTTSADKNHPDGHNRKWTYWSKYHLIDYVDDETTEIGIGSKVIWSGRLHTTSTGSKPTNAWKKTEGVIDIINDNSHGIHIEGKGWIARNQILGAEEKPEPTPKPTPTIPKEYLQLSSRVTSWNVYPLNKPARVGNEIGRLLPSRFGGLEYEILDRPSANVATIQTRDFGKVNIYIGKETAHKIVKK